MSDTEAIVAVLQGMNPEDDTQWTTSGLARMDYVEGQLGDTSIERRHINAAWTGFNRATLQAWLQENEVAEPDTPSPVHSEDVVMDTPQVSETTPDEDVTLENVETGEVTTVEVDDEPKTIFLPDEWGGTMINPNAGPVSHQSCLDGDYEDPQVYTLWLENRLYTIERTTTGETPAFPKG